MIIIQPQLENHLWESANILRGPVDAADFKTYIFPLLFFKRISDVYDEELVTALEESGGDEEYAYFPENHRFQIPEGCHWNDVRAKSENIGYALQKAMRNIEQANTDTLHGIFGDAQWTNKDRLSDSLLKDLIEHFSKLSFGNKRCRSDILGQSYEYLIKKFADLTNKKAGEFYTPRSVVALMVKILAPQTGDTIYDPACGTGGMLLEALHYVDRTVGGYEGLMVAQDCLPNNETRDRFAGEFSVLSTIWEALSPDPCLTPYRNDYKWLTQVYESVKPPSGNGKLLWHALGAKTIELVHENVHIDTVRDDLETLVMDAEVLEEILSDLDPKKKGKEVEIRLIARLRKHKGNPKFIQLGERLEKIKERHEQGLLNSIDFLKDLLMLAKEVVEAEQEVDPEDEQDKAKAALSDLFAEAKSEDTPVVVERIVTDIDEIVRLVRFPGWQSTNAGEREVQKALRKVIYVKYKIKDQDLFDKAYGYIRQYY